MQAARWSLYLSSKQPHASQRRLVESRGSRSRLHSTTWNRSELTCRAQSVGTAVSARAQLRPAWERSRTCSSRVSLGSKHLLLWCFSLAADAKYCHPCRHSPGSASWSSAAACCGRGGEVPSSMSAHAGRSAGGTAKRERACSSADKHSLSPVLSAGGVCK